MAPDPALQLLLKSHPRSGLVGDDDPLEVIRRRQADYRERFASALGPLVETA